MSQSVIRGRATHQSGGGNTASGSNKVDPGRANHIARIPAGDTEAAVIAQLRILLQSPEIVVATWRAARKQAPDVTEAEVREALERFDPLWDELFPAEQARIVHLLVERVDVVQAGIDIRLNVAGLTQLIGGLRANASREAA